MTKKRIEHTIGHFKKILITAYTSQSATQDRVLAAVKVVHNL